MASDAFLINLSPAQKTALIKRAALMTAESGKRVTMSDLVRDVIEQLVSSPLNDSPDDKTNSIKFTPIPSIAKALKSAHYSSGRPMGEIVNQMLAEALQAEGTSM